MILAGGGYWNSSGNDLWMHHAPLTKARVIMLQARQRAAAEVGPSCKHTSARNQLGGVGGGVSQAVYKTKLV